MFDDALLNAAVAKQFCNKQASWVTASGATAIAVLLDSAPANPVEGVISVGDELITAECESKTVVGMTRKQQLIIEQVTYGILDVSHDANGWATLYLEKL